ncbi:MAG: S-layer homology domain-containing protein, partial [Oscillospiraceae bacterium]|nr:S-layer homology domain-containing protein [Oscillospiraceae bacterium]
FTPGVPNVIYTVTGVRPPTYSGMPVTPQPTPAGTIVVVAGIPTTTATRNAAGVTGTWTFNGWNHASITTPTFVMPNQDVTFTGFWVFTPDDNEPDLTPFSPYHNSFIIGRPSGNIYPGANMTRAEVATIFFRLLSDDFRVEVWEQQNQFDDVSGTQWFNNAVSTMANAGVVQGRPDGTFQPNHSITRAEVAAMVARFFEEPGRVERAFTDISGHWAENYINRLAQFGWVEGSGDGSFRPNDLITRAEVAAIVNRMLNRVPDSTDSLLDGRTRWPDKTNTNAWYYLYLQEASHSTEFVRLTNGNLNWTEILPHIEWQRLERPHSRPSDIRVSRR